MSNLNRCTGLPSIERHVGRRVRTARCMLGLSQQRMSNLLGISARQLHLYETAQNRITVGRLHQIAQALALDINFFFEGLDDAHEQPVDVPGRLITELSRAFMNIRSPQYQTVICNAARALALSDREQPLSLQRSARPHHWRSDDPNLPATSNKHSVA